MLFIANHKFFYSRNSFLDTNLCQGTIPFLLLAVALLLFVICSIATFVALAVPLFFFFLIFGLNVRILFGERGYI